MSPQEQCLTRDPSLSCLPWTLRHPLELSELHSSHWSLGASRGQTPDQRKLGRCCCLRHQVLVTPVRSGTCAQLSVALMIQPPGLPLGILRTLRVQSPSGPPKGPSARKQSLFPRMQCQRPVKSQACVVDSRAHRMPPPPLVCPLLFGLRQELFPSWEGQLSVRWRPSDTEKPVL